MNPGRIVPLHLLFCIVQSESWGWPIPEAKAATKPIQPTSGQESPHPQQNIQSQQFKPSTTPAHVAIVAFASFYLLKMASPKAALEPKAAMAVTFVQTTGGRESSRPLQNIQSQGFRINTPPVPMFIVVCPSVRFLGMANPKMALEPKATAA